MTHKEKILALKPGETYVWPESDYGLAEIKNADGGFALFEIPEFGGIERFVRWFCREGIDDLVREVESWT